MTLVARQDGIDAEVEGTVCVVRLRGALDRSNATDLTTLVAAEESCSRVLIDLSLLSTIDATGVSMLESLVETTRARGMEIGIYAASGEVAKALGTLPDRLPAIGRNDQLAP